MGQRRTFILMKEDVRFGSTSTDWGQSQQVCLPLTPEVGRAARDRREGPTTEAVLVCELNASVSPNVILCDVSGMALLKRLMTPLSPSVRTRTDGAQAR